MHRQQIIVISIIIVTISAFVLMASTRDYSVLNNDVVRITDPWAGYEYLVGERVEISIEFDPHGAYQLDPVATGWEIKVTGDDGSVTNVAHEYSTSYTSKFVRTYYFTPAKTATYTVRGELVIRETYQSDDDPATDPAGGTPGDVVYDLTVGTGETLYYNTVRFSVAEEIVAQDEIPETTTGANVSYVSGGFELVALVLAIAAIPLVRRLKDRE